MKSSPESARDVSRSGAVGRHSKVWGHTLATGVICLTALTLLQRGVGLGRSFVVCRWLSTEELGRWDLSFGFLMAIGPLVVLGLPGSFGRFSENYRNSHQLIRFIRITAIACLLIFSISLAALLGLRRQIGQHFLGFERDADWVVALLPVLIAVVVFNYLTALINSLRLHRGFAGVHGVHGVSFAVLCLLFIPICSFQAIGVVVAYGVACVISSILATRLLYREITNDTYNTDGQGRNVPHDGPFLPEFLSVMRAILPFACSVWLAALVANTFRISDRLLILHFSANEPLALSFIGQYHAARVIPRLFTQFAMSLAGMLTPHLVQDWDHGNPQRVNERLATMLKFVSIGSCGTAALVLVLAPTLFSLLMKDKFDLAIEMLPWAFASAITFGLAFLLQNVFWCSKKTWWTSLSFLVGLAVNVSLGIVLLPRLGIVGVAIGTFLATTVTLWCMLLIAARIGFRFSTATYTLLILPGALAGGAFVTGSILTVIGLATVVLGAFLTGKERAKLRGILSNGLQMIPLAATSRPESPQTPTS